MAVAANSSQFRLWGLILIGVLIFACSLFYHQHGNKLTMDSSQQLGDRSTVNNTHQYHLAAVQHGDDHSMVISPVLPPSMLEKEQSNQQPAAATATSFEERDKLNTTRDQKKSRISWQSVKIELDLAEARAAIREASRLQNYTTSFTGEESSPFVLTYKQVYRNPHTFIQSHVEMMNRFKVWTYTEGDPPLFHQSPTKDIYGIDGHFMDEMDNPHHNNNGGMSRFRANHPDEAHAFFIPWSIVNIVEYIYKPVVSFSRAPLNRMVLDYANLIAQRYPFWNRSLGADHFMLSCHDWAPDVLRADPTRFKNFIRAVCNANTSEGFNPVRDVSIAEIKVPVNNLNPPNHLALRPSMRSVLAFFAGGEHGHVRKFLFQHWEKNVDKEILVYKNFPGNQEDYFKMFGKSKFCLCPSGYEVASPRIVEAVHAECVPVIISKDFMVPFSDVLDWSQFSVYIPVEKIPEIKKILKGISMRRYLKLVRGVRSVKWHFTLNRPAKPFDILHMSLHSVWLRRLNIRLP